MPELENRMVIPERLEAEKTEEDIPVCECCEEKIKQFRALHMLSGTKKVWICDKCIEDLKEVTGW